MTLALCSTAALAGARPTHGPRAKAAPPPTADQQEVVAQIVADTFRRPKREPYTLALCLDVQIGPDVDGEPLMPPEPPRHARHKRAPATPPPPAVHGAPPELIARLARPWRLLASAAACHLDARQPIALPDEHHTPAQLVTVRLPPDAASGTVRIDWTDGHDAAPAQSRDCTATRGPRGWSVQCGGTWYQ